MKTDPEETIWKKACSGSKVGYFSGKMKSFFLPWLQGEMGLCSRPVKCVAHMCTVKKANAEVRMWLAEIAVPACHIPFPSTRVASPCPGSFHLGIFWAALRCTGCVSVPCGGYPWAQVLWSRHASLIYLSRLDLWQSLVISSSTCL